MLIFIDDSGDPGFNITKGASRFFVIACVIFDNELEAEKTAVALKQLKRDLRFPDSMEFKFNKNQAKVRQSFLKTLLEFDFKIRCIVVDKKIVRSHELQNNQHSFYSYFIKQVLQHSKEIRDAKIRLDGHGDRIFKRNLYTYLRQELNSRGSRTIETLQVVDSKKNILIQMADMIAGAIRRSYEMEKADAKSYRRIIKGKIEDCWEFA